MKLKIVKPSLSGWTRDYKPKDVKAIYDIKLNRKRQLVPFFIFVL